MRPALEDRLRVRARDLGFDAVGITLAGQAPDLEARLAAFLDAGYQGDMDFMAEKKDRRADVTVLWPEAKSLVMLAVNYNAGLDAKTRLAARSAGVISTYALNRDYHELVKGKLKHLAQWLAVNTKAQVKVFVDTAPLMEKPHAMAAGLGWQGRHTNLVSRDLGSWFFLGAIVTEATLVPDAPEKDHCGSCRACLDVCPTNAFPVPYTLDARRCISYLTIEHRGMIDREFRPLMGNRIYGCDDCLDVCPWNKFAQAATEIKFRPRSDLVAPGLADLLTLDDAGFRALFAGSPVKRIGRNRFVRNVLVAAGNSSDAALVPPVLALLADASPLVRAMAVWALAKLLPVAELASLRDTHSVSETDADVLEEWSMIA